MAMMIITITRSCISARVSLWTVPSLKAVVTSPSSNESEGKSNPAQAADIDPKTNKTLSFLLV